MTRIKAQIIAKIKWMHHGNRLVFPWILFLYHICNENWAENLHHAWKVPKKWALFVFFYLDFRRFDASLDNSVYQFGFRYIFYKPENKQYSHCWCRWIMKENINTPIPNDRRVFIASKRREIERYVDVKQPKMKFVVFGWTPVVQVMQFECFFP